jgi:hypothetical protein
VTIQLQKNVDANPGSSFVAVKHWMISND